MWKLHAAGLPIERQMLLDRLRHSNEFSTDSPAAYLLELTQDVASALRHAPDYARQIVQQRKKGDRLEQIKHGNISTAMATLPRTLTRICLRRQTTGFANVEPISHDLNSTRLPN